MLCSKITIKNLYFVINVIIILAIVKNEFINMYKRPTSNYNTTNNNHNNNCSTVQKTNNSTQPNSYSSKTMCCNKFCKKDLEDKIINLTKQFVI